MNSRAKLSVIPGTRASEFNPNLADDHKRLAASLALTAGSSGCSRLSILTMKLRSF